MARGIVYAIISAVCFGTLAIFAKLGLGMGMVPLQVVQYRFFFGALMLLAWMGLTRPHLFRIGPKALVKAMVLGVGFYPFQSWCFIKSLQYLPAATTSLIYYLYPLATTLIAVAFLRLKPGRAVYVSLMLILGGCCLIFYNAFAQSVDMRGIAFALACMVTFSVYLTLVQVFVTSGEAGRISLWVVLFMAVTFSLLSSPLSILHQPPMGWFVALGLGFVPTALAISLLYNAVESIGSAYAAMLSTIEPVTTVLLAALVLGESVDAVQIAGMALIIAGIVLPNLNLIRRKAAVADRMAR